MKKADIAIVTPVYNDWDSFQQLVRDIDAHLAPIASNVTIIAVDDGSTESFPGTEPLPKTFKAITRIEILKLARNTGHQRAIAIGLAYLEKHYYADQVAVMDADGEDSPSELPNMLAEQRKTGKIVFAKRGKRRENILFRFFYVVYRVLFRLLTGKQMTFGNFCVIPGKSLRQVVFLPEIWSHLASGILRSGLPQATLLVDRKRRYHGKTKMNFTGLVMHGLSAFSVYTDILSVRMILFTLVIIAATIIGALVLLYVKYFTPLAIPGWATTVGFGLVVILLQALVMLLSLAFNVLNSRSMQTYIPAKHFEDFLLMTETVYERA